MDTAGRGMLGLVSVGIVMSSCFKYCASVSCHHLATRHHKSSSSTTQTQVVLAAKFLVDS